MSILDRAAHLVLLSLVPLLGLVIPPSAPAGSHAPSHAVWNSPSLTQPPVSEITVPAEIEELDFLLVGPVLPLAWTGTDPDGSGPDPRPVAYLVKVLRLDTLGPPRTTLNTLDPDLLYQEGGPWVRVASREVAAPGDLTFLVACETGGLRCLDMRSRFGPDTTAAWSPWGPADAPIPVTVPAGTSRLQVEVRDEAEQAARVTLELIGVELLFDRDVLLVDDFLDTVNPRDGEHDAFWEARFNAYGATPDVHDVFGAGDLMLVPDAPSLAELGRYRMVVWNVSGAGYNGRTALLEAAGISRVLGNYLRGGGRLWVSGRLTIPALLEPRVTLIGDLAYPKFPEPGSFVWDFLKLRGVEIDNDKSATHRHLLAGVVPSTDPGNEFSAMDVDLSKLNVVQAQYGGIGHVDAILDPRPFGPGPESPGLLEPLFTYGAVGPRLLGEASRYNNAVCAVRWHDPGPDPEHGRVMWFGFPLYSMNDDEAQDTFDRAMEWLAADEPPIPVRLLYLSVERAGSAARLSWGVADALDHAGFHVYREDRAGERVRLTGDLLSGWEEYVFVDEEAPARSARYWLAKHSRTGSVQWHGPVRLEAEVLTSPGPVLRTPSPNPFRSRTTLSFTVDAPGTVTLDVLDVRGRRVRRLVRENAAAGDHTVTWDGAGDGGAPVSAGLYFARLSTTAGVRLTKVLLLP